MYELRIYKKSEGKKDWEETAYSDHDKTRVLESLTYSLMNRYIWKGAIERIKDRNNYDGTRTIEVYFRSGISKYKYVYIVEL